MQKNTQIILSLENNKKWWETKLQEIVGEERKAILFKKLTPYIGIEILLIFVSIAFLGVSL
jgi:predicted metal-dependent hydrolase